MSHPSASLPDARFRIRITEQTTVLQADEAVQALLGFPAEDFLSGAVSLAARIHADDQDIAQALFARNAADGLQAFNLRLRQANGRIRCVKATCERSALPEGGALLELLLQDARGLARTMDDPQGMVNFRAMMENTDDFIYFKDRNHVFTGASQTLVALCEPAEHWTDLLGQTDYDVFPEAYADIYYRLEKQVFAGIPVAREVQEMLSRDGRPGWVDNRKYPIRDDAGEIIGLYGIARDITELKRGEQALRDEEEKFHSLYAAMTEGMALHELVCDASGAPQDYRLLDVNPAYEAILGRPRDTVIGRLASAVYGQAPYLAEFADVAMTRQPRRFEARFEQLNRVFDISVFSPARGRFATVFEDISERKAAEAALNGFFEQSANLHLIVRFDGTIQRVNKGWQQTLGYPVEDLLGKAFIDLVHPDDRNASLMELAKLAQGQTTFHFENRYRHASGAYRLFAWSANAVVEDQLIYALASDITESKLIAEELERHRTQLEELVASRTADLAVAREAAEAASRAKSSFLASMSHELRTPLNGIMGMTDLARRRATDPRQKEQLDRVAQASTHLLEVINDILDIARIEANRLELKVVDFTMAGLMEEMTGLLSQHATQKGLKLGIDIDRRLAGLVLQGDPMRLRQILLNLSGNAIKFTEHGSTILHARVAEEHEHQVLVRFEVRDTGIGISEEDQKRLFQPFQQIDASLTRNHGGTGLGLAICKRLAEAMGGTIGITSQPGLGSTFWFTVLLGKAAPALASATQAAVEPATLGAEATLRAHYSGARVLLVEDEPINQEVARYLLAEAGLDVDVADDGVEALDKVRQKPYALILMDLQMPRMNGLDAARAIRALPGCEALPIVAMTANAFEEDRQSCLAAGMNDFIAKPVRPGLLHETTLRWLRQAVVEDFDQPVR